MSKKKANSYDFETILDFNSENSENSYQSVDLDVPEYDLRTNYMPERLMNLINTLNEFSNAILREIFFMVKQIIDGGAAIILHVI